MACLSILYNDNRIRDKIEICGLQLVGDPTLTWMCQCQQEESLFSKEVLLPMTHSIPQHGLNFGCCMWLRNGVVHVQTVRLKEIF